MPDSCEGEGSVQEAEVDIVTDRVEYRWQFDSDNKGQAGRYEPYK